MKLSAKERKQYNKAANKAASEMTMLEHMATQIAAGMMGNSEIDMYHKDLATTAYHQAEALICKLEGLA